MVVKSKTRVSYLNSYIREEKRIKLISPAFNSRI